MSLAAAVEAPPSPPGARLLGSRVVRLARRLRIPERSGGPFGINLRHHPVAVSRLTLPPPPAASAPTVPTAYMRNDAIAKILEETADLLELTGGNPYRASAFTRAARSIGNLEQSVRDRLDDGSLTEVSGIGDGMAGHIADILEGGSFDLRDELISGIPPGLMDVMRVKGLGTKRTRRLWTELDVTSLDELEEAAEEGRITTLDGFGAKTQQNILENVRRLRHYEARQRLSEAWTATQEFLRALRAVEAVDRAKPTGPLRRQREVVEQADVLVGTNDPESVEAWLREQLGDVSSGDAAAITGTLQEGVPLHVHLASPSRFGTAWWRTTGSPEHCAAFVEAYGEPGAHADEESVFGEAGLPLIPAVLRENRNELDAAARGELPALLTTDELQGCLHNHSTYSDGANTVREMAEAARNRGYSYFGICDHSQSLQIADGLSPEAVREQHAEVERLNEAFANDGDEPFQIFHGIESDVLANGSLDYGEQTLALFDFVVASIHTGFSMTKGEATQRLVRAIENPYTRILGHPTGRLLLRREGYPIDHDSIISACADHNVAIELNANPQRLDLDWRWVRSAIDRGVSISINPDAHAIREIDNTRWGVAVAQKGWLTRDHCLNAKSLDAFREWLDSGIR